MLFLAMCYVTSLGQDVSTTDYVLEQVQEIIYPGDSENPYSLIPFFSSKGFAVRTASKSDAEVYPKLKTADGYELNVAIGEFNVYDYFIDLHPTKSVFYSAGENGEVIMFYSLERLRKLYDRSIANDKAKANQ